MIILGLSWSQNDFIEEVNFTVIEETGGLGKNHQSAQFFSTQML